MHMSRDLIKVKRTGNFLINNFKRIIQNKQTITTIYLAYEIGILRTQYRFTRLKDIFHVSINQERTEM